MRGAAGVLAVLLVASAARAQVPRPTAPAVPAGLQVTLGPQRPFFVLGTDAELQVVWPEGERHGDTAAITGRVGPASLVTINGAQAPVGADGHFTATVPLREGSNRVAVQTEDLTGRRREAATTLVRRPTRLPKLAPEPGELWKK